MISLTETQAAHDDAKTDCEILDGELIDIDDEIEMLRDKKADLREEIQKLAGELRTAKKEQRSREDKEDLLDDIKKTVKDYHAIRAELNQLFRKRYDICLALAMAEDALENAQADLDRAENIAALGLDEGLYACETCNHLDTGGYYDAGCPNRPHGYDPIARVEAGAKHPEDYCCQSWTPARDWYYSLATAQETRDAIPSNLKP